MDPQAVTVRRLTPMWQPRCRWKIQSALTVCLTMIVAGAASAADDPPEPLELQKYRVHVSLSFAADPLLNPMFQKRLERELPQRIERSFGSMWQLDLNRSPSVMPARRTGLERIEAAELAASWPESSSDKLMLLAVWHEAGKYYVGGREWDSRARHLTRVRQVETGDRRRVAEIAFEVLLGLFRPWVQIDTVDRDVIGMRMQAGEFPAPDPAAQQIRPGDVILPLLRYRDRDKVVQRVQMLPVTYIAVQNRDRARAQGVLVSDLNMTLSTRGRRRVDQMGLRVRPDLPATELQFVLRNRNSRRLIGHRVRGYYKLRANDKTDVEPQEFLTDRHGRIRLPTHHPQHPIAWVYVHSGNELLALERIPFVAGLQPHVTLELLDDSIRLGVEGELDLLEGQLIDLIARQAVFQAFALKAAEKGDRDAVQENLAKIDQLPKLRDFREQLNAIRVPAVDRARRTRNRLAESRVERMVRKLGEVVDRYLAAERMLQFREKLNDKLEAGPTETPTS